MVTRTYRIAHWLYDHKVPLLPFLLNALTRILFSAVIPPSVKIGKGVLLSYQGLGTAIHRRTVIGPNATIGTGVTIGGRAGCIQVPGIGEGAMIGTGAKILGPVSIGKFASIGANAVVLDNVPDYGVAVGIPARVIRINDPLQVPDYRSFTREK